MLVAWSTHQAPANEQVRGRSHGQFLLGDSGCAGGLHIAWLGCGSLRLPWYLFCIGRRKWGRQPLATAWTHNTSVEDFRKPREWKGKIQALLIRGQSENLSLGGLGLPFMALPEARLTTSSVSGSVHFGWFQIPHVRLSFGVWWTSVTLPNAIGWANKNAHESWLKLITNVMMSHKSLLIGVY